ncbi:hypothetical protein MK489_04635 [Myxococcota bacterium]|nr:hypothetical protein [Myxococcota bacterium]
MLRTATATVAFCLFALGCMPEPTTDDNGNSSWVQQMVPELLGRKSRGWEETDVLAKAAGLLGRTAVTRAVTLDPDFAVNWSEILVDHLQVQRADLFAANRTANTQCWGGPMAFEEGESDGGQLALWVDKHHPDGSNAPVEPIPGGLPGAGNLPSHDWNMIDLIRSSLELDDLGPIYLSHLIPFQMHPGYQSDSRPAGRERIGTAFDKLYLGRNQSCMGCHNENYSLSDNIPGWHRTYEPFPVTEAKVLEEPFGSESTLVSSHAPFDPEIRGGDFYPWGIDPSCVRGKKVGASIEGMHPNTPNPDPVEAKLASITGTGRNILDVEAALRQGIEELSGESLASYTNDVDFTEDQAMAYMLALNISNNVWEQIMGERLTIPHGYSRNIPQRGMLRYLTEEKLLRNNWSLGSLLEAILTSDWFNRTAPYAANDAVHDSPYHLPMLLDPWLAVHPGETDAAPETRFNGQGRVVHRYAPRVLVRSLAKALGHETLPPHLVSNSGTERAFAENMGQYINDYRPGTRSMDFVAAMSWFDRHGACQTPVGQGEDWIDTLRDAAMDWDDNHPEEPPLLLRDVALTLKDWLIGEATLDADLPEGTETTTVEALFDGYSLDTLVADIAPGDLEDGARQYCGALVSSPQFVLAGIRPAEIGEGSRLRVCNPGEPCTWAETCEAWIEHLEAASGKQLACLPNSRTVLDLDSLNLDLPNLDRPEFTQPGVDLHRTDPGHTEVDPTPIDRGPPASVEIQPAPAPSPVPPRDPATPANGTGRLTL